MHVTTLRSFRSGGCARHTSPRRARLIRVGCYDRLRLVHLLVEPQQLVTGVRHENLVDVVQLHKEYTQLISEKHLLSIRCIMCTQQIETRPDEPRIRFLI
jgi:hypothetical protein